VTELSLLRRTLPEVHRLAPRVRDDVYEKHRGLHVSGRICLGGGSTEDTYGTSWAKASRPCDANRSKTLVIGPTGV
jgi:hypothetical protein